MENTNVITNTDDKLLSKVDHPSHYNWHPVSECIDISEHFNANLSKAMEYIWRAGFKEGESDVKDLLKTLWYIKRELKRKRKFEGAILPDNWEMCEVCKNENSKRSG